MSGLRGRQRRVAMGHLSRRAELRALRGRLPAGDPFRPPEKRESVAVLHAGGGGRVSGSSAGTIEAHANFTPFSNHGSRQGSIGTPQFS